jgi:DNA-binding NtrC family response regulator
MDMPKILIVEDDEVLASLMATVLAEAGYDSEVAPSPEHARGSYDLVVADYLAPHFEPGQPWPFLEQLRALCQNGPILGCTGHQDALSDPVATLGVSAITSKPFDVEDLLQTVEQLLDQGRRVAEASPLAPASAESTLPAL